MVVTDPADIACPRGRGEDRVRTSGLHLGACDKAEGWDKAEGCDKVEGCDRAEGWDKDEGCDKVEGCC